MLELTKRILFDSYGVMKRVTRVALVAINIDCFIINRILILPLPSEARRADATL